MSVCEGIWSCVHVILYSMLNSVSIWVICIFYNNGIKTFREYHIQTIDSYNYHHGKDLNNRHFFQMTFCTSFEGILWLFVNWLSMTNEQQLHYLDTHSTTRKSLLLCFLMCRHGCYCLRSKHRKGLALTFWCIGVYASCGFLWASIELQYSHIS